MCVTKIYIPSTNNDSDRNFAFFDGIASKEKSRCGFAKSYDCFENSLDMVISLLVKTVA